jgi:hypothetical protein
VNSFHDVISIYGALFHEGFFIRSVFCKILNNFDQKKSNMDEWQLTMKVTLEEYYQILAQRAENKGITFIWSGEGNLSSEESTEEDSKSGEGDSTSEESGEDDSESSELGK